MMRKLGFFVIFFLMASTILARSGPDFDRFFKDRTLRMDYIHTGTKTKSMYSLGTFYEEGPWPGSVTNLVDTLNLGNYLLRVYDLKTNVLIYSYGYSTLFREWQTTDEAAREIQRSFKETLCMPLPKRPVQITISERDRTNHFREKYHTLLDPNSRSIVRENRVPAGTVSQTLTHAGNPHKSVDLAILAEGYTSSQKKKFFRDAQKHAAVLLNTEPFRSNKNRISVRAVFVPSPESGPDQPRKGIFHHTAFDFTFNSLDLPRYLIEGNTWAVHDAASAVPYDNIYVLVNSSRYGGGAIFNYYAVCISDNPWSDYIFVHEFGHAFGGLGDEYYSSAVTYNDFYPPGVEPWEPNITALLDTAALKWKDLVTPGTPLPTPPDTAKYGNVVGAFEGAGYVAKGLYRPTLNHCIMFQKNWRDYCPVCRRAIEKVIRFKSE